MLGRAPLDGVVTIVVARTLFEQQKEGRVDLLGTGIGAGAGAGAGAAAAAAAGVGVGVYSCLPCPGSGPREGRAARTVLPTRPSN